MPLLSIITPTQAHNAEHIGALWTSIADQRLPEGWELEWLVQEDGTTPAVRPLLPEDDRVAYDALGVQVGGPTTRNHALARSRGDLIAGIDHDDHYLDGGLAALIGPFEERGVAWTSGRCRWQMEDGSTWTKDDVLPAGRVAAGTIADHFLATDDFPFPAAITTYRRQALVAHGGWPAVARSDDAVLLAAFGDTHDGWWVDRAVAVYRRWPSQKTVQSEDWAIRDLPHVRGVIGQRRAAHERLAGQAPGTATSGAGGDGPVAAAPLAPGADVKPG